MSEARPVKETVLGIALSNHLTRTLCTPLLTREIVAGSLQHFIKPASDLYLDYLNDAERANFMTSARAFAASLQEPLKTLDQVPCDWRGVVQVSTQVVQDEIFKWIVFMFTEGKLPLPRSC
jgi:hypothetical protein